MYKKLLEIYYNVNKKRIDTKKNDGITCLAHTSLFKKYLHDF